MNKIKEFTKRYISADLPMRLCVFNMMTVVGVIAGVVSLITTYMMKINNGQVIPMAVAMLALIFFMYLANYKGRLNLAAALICSSMGFVLFPEMFIKGGGIYSGMPVWFMLVIVFSAILIEGKLKYIIILVLIIEDCSLIIFAYLHPERLNYFNGDDMVFMDVAQSIFFVGVCIASIISFQLYMYDIAYKRAEEAVKEAEAANMAKSDFLASMSHEIRTPMGVIIGMNEMIQRESNQENIVDYSEDVSRAAKLLLSIINDILDFSKIESGKMNIVESDYDIKLLISDVLDMAKIKQEQTGIDFEVKIDESIPRKYYGDDLRIKQCLINIISNAFKYTEKGKIVFEVSGVSTGEQESLTFSVTDTGIGIKPEDKEKLFESFVRLDEVHNRGIQGTGLGLNITASLLCLMNSELKVESEFGKGSRFYFTINQQIIDHTKLCDEETDNHVKEEYVSEFTAPDAQVLVVDDSKINLKVFKTLLKRTQITIDTAQSGEEAIEILRNKQYDIVFMDHMMPGLDGEETFKKLVEESIIGDTPTIMLTANAILGMREHFIEIGFTDYLTKPIEYIKLEEMLRKYLHMM